MKLKDGRITILFNDDNLQIELHDLQAGQQFAKVVLTPKQTMQAFSRLGYTKCSIELYGLERVGLKLENKTFEFSLGISDEGWQTIQTRKELATREAKAQCPEGWTPDCYFGSKDSFFQRDNEQWAKTTIRRWV